MSQNVFVIGLGNMGTALAGTLLEKGYALTVWNRTESRATALVEAGARLAKSIAEGITANEVILVCLNNYDDSRNCLRACSDLTHNRFNEGCKRPASLGHSTWRTILRWRDFGISQRHRQPQLHAFSCGSESRLVIGPRHHSIAWPY